MKRLFLLDAYALIFRAYYALIRMPRITQGGFNTSAIFGFVNTLEEVLRKENPTHIAVCFDPSGPTFRKEAYEDYKAERSATPEDIRLSVPIIKEIVKAYNIPVVEVEGYEADDVIGTLAKMAEKEDFTTYMMTPDKDYGQLVSSNVLQYKPSYRGQDFEIRGEKEVCERYGLQKTIQIIDLLALMGDKSDNIPGCPGVGEKTAVKLINEYGSVEELLKHTENLKGTLRKKVEEYKEQIKFSKFLATIKTDVPVDITPEELIRKEADRSKLFAIFKELEFRSLIERVGKRLDGDAHTGSNNAFSKKLKLESNKGVSKNDNEYKSGISLFNDSDFGESMSAVEIDDTNYRLVDNNETLVELNRVLGERNRCGIYFYSEGENDVMSQWIGVSVCVGNGESYYISSENENGKALILDLLARGDIEKVSINVKRDYVIASRERRDRVKPIENFYDLGLAHYVVQPDMRHGLDSLCPEYLGFESGINPSKANSKKGNKTLFEEEGVDIEIAQWACRQADITLRLREALEKAVSESGMEKLLNDVEIPLVEVLAEMELTGVRIDTKALRRTEDDMTKRLSSIENEIYNLAGVDFNVSSPSQVGEILFDRLGLDPKAKKTKTGQYSTSEDILEKLVGKHPIVKKIMEYRALRKLLTTYVSALPAAINTTTGRVHTNYNQTVTSTGRLSSSSPNLQNIPVRDDEGREIRRAFISDEGCLFLSADYSQIELRLLADFSNDEIMLEAFREGKDIHSITASKIYHKSQEDVTDSERRHAKTANFGIVYGISAFGLANRLGISRGEAKEIIDNYFDTFPTVRQYMNESIEKAREHGYVETRMGRRRILADINSRNPVVRGYAERNAINAPLQGTAADIIKIAMIRIYSEIKRRGLKSRMIMQVHDELNFNVPESEIGIMQELVSSEMEGAYNGKVRLTASSGVGSNWLDAH